MRASRRTLSAMASGFLLEAGNGTCRPPTACTSLASSPGSQATSARAPASTSAAATASVERSSPPAARGGTICRIVRPASGAFDAAPEGGERVDAHARLRSSARARLTGAPPRPSRRRPRPHEVEARASSRIMRTNLSVSNEEPQFFTVGNPPNQRRIAFRRRAPARSGAPGLVWLCGYRSDMDSTKASALDAEAERLGLGLLRFDYSRPRPLGRAARGRHDLALARGDAGDRSGRNRGPADPARLVDGRLSRAARGARARSRRAKPVGSPASS